MNPTLTYRTVLAKKRNTKFEKNQKNFLDIKKARLTTGKTSDMHQIRLKKGKKIEAYDFLQS